ncbi:hypothetical protein BD310DRAFT_476384 [Dichomitus squalens]|uniref:Uncharacterized protein n=1 Tax=Dichomitus squalens TaxID=114155 RepID=A0A4V6MWT1_9APHY|nr:hypothetical protein BD310DRAFT_476384 [Dichomitus squalens]
MLPETNYREAYCNTALPPQTKRPKIIHTPRCHRGPAPNVRWILVADNHTKVLSTMGRAKSSGIES